MDNKQLKIYFCGSIRGVSADHNSYQCIVSELQKYGSVLTIHVAYPGMEKVSSDKEIYDRDYKWFQESEIMVAEVTAPSHGVGIEIGWAIQRENYKILCLSKKNKQFQISALISGCSKITYLEYDNEADIKQIITDFMQSNIKK